MKTRLQLQGELIKTSDAQKVYKNVFDVFRKTWANEGLRGLQRGLGPAVSECEKRGGVMIADGLHSSLFASLFNRFRDVVRLPSKSPDASLHSRDSPPTYRSCLTDPV